MRDHSVIWFKPSIRLLIHRSVHQVACLVLVLLVLLLLVAFYNFRTFDTENTNVEVLADNIKFSYNRLSPLIFVGGFPRSGTTLMRAMLDAHPLVRCGQETRVIPRILHFRQMLYTKIEKARLKEAGVTEELLNRAMATFILEIMVHHAEPAPRLCTKDPFIISSAQYLSKLFPRAKFIFMVRDGRASIYSAIVRNVTIAGYNYKDPRSCLEKWNHSVAVMYNQCGSLGPRHCMMVHYEQLVLHPALWMREILSFLDVSWDEVVLHHDQQINKSGGVRLSRLEKSSDQIIKPVNIEALSKWVGFYPSDVVKEMGEIAPMLEKLGYDPNANPPNYGTPDSSVLENTKLIKKEINFWTERALQLHLVNRHLRDPDYSNLVLK